MLVTLRSQSDLLNHYRALMRDPSGTAARWTDAEYYHAINRALVSWGQRVRVPWLHTLDDGWSSSIYAYTLPSYMDSYIRPQVQSPTGVWDDLSGWTLEPNGTGGLVLRWQTPPIDDDGRIIWYMPVSQVPVEVATLGSSLSDNPDSGSYGQLFAYVPLGFSPAKAGWVRINGEWIHYAGVTRDAPQPNVNAVSLETLTRGQFDTEVATHDADATVEWGIAVDRDDLWGVLDDQVMEHLHAMFMTNASNTETDTHAVMMKYHGDRVQGFWRSYTPTWRPRILLTREAMGARVY